MPQRPTLRVTVQFEESELEDEPSSTEDEPSSLSEEAAEEDEGADSHSKDRRLLLLEDGEKEDEPSSTEELDDGLPTHLGSKKGSTANNTAFKIDPTTGTLMALPTPLAICMRLNVRGISLGDIPCKRHISTR